MSIEALEVKSSRLHRNQFQKQFSKCFFLDYPKRIHGPPFKDGTEEIVTHDFIKGFAHNSGLITNRFFEIGIQFRSMNERMYSAASGTIAR